jgi:hypothetical protein
MEFRGRFHFAQKYVIYVLNAVWPLAMFQCLLLPLISLNLSCRDS